MYGKILKLVLVILFPYLILFTLICVFNRYFIESLFQNNIFLLFLTLFIFYFAALVSSVITFVKSFSQKQNAQKLLRVNMIIKLIHIPSYILIFIIGFFLLTIFTFPITILLIIFDCMTIFLTGLIGLGGILRNLKENKITMKEAVVHGILQFIFCADVFSSIIIYKKVKK